MSFYAIAVAHCGWGKLPNGKQTSNAKITSKKGTTEEESWLNASVKNHSRPEIQLELGREIIYFLYPIFHSFFQLSFHLHFELFHKMQRLNHPSIRPYPPTKGRLR